MVVKKIIGKIQSKIKKNNQIIQDGQKITKCLMEQESIYGLNETERSQKIIVSLTSFPPRFEQLHLVIRSMLVQTMRPDELLLYLADAESETLPESLLEMKQYGLKIETRPGNLKPHKKYYYVMKENPDAIIITIDDDLLYPPNTIEELYSTYRRFPNCVVASRAHKMLFHPDGSVKKYNDWEWTYSEEYVPSMQLLATGCGGVLYPPHCMHDDLLNMELLQKLTLQADDLWLKVMQVLKGTKVVLCSQEIRKNRALVPGSQEASLNSTNVHQNINDVYLKNLLEYYHLTADSFSDEVAV